MLFLLAALAASATAPSVIPTPETARPLRCAAPIHYARKGGPERGLHRLDQEPPANAYLAVDRRIGGCPAPAVIRTGIRR